MRGTKQPNDIVPQDKLQKKTLTFGQPFVGKRVGSPISGGFSCSGISKKKKKREEGERGKNQLLLSIC